jgi:hypothetical protein
LDRGSEYLLSSANGGEVKIEEITGGLLMIDNGGGTVTVVIPKRTAAGLVARISIGIATRDVLHVHHLYITFLNQPLDL